VVTQQQQPELVTSQSAELEPTLSASCSTPTVSKSRKRRQPAQSQSDFDVYAKSMETLEQLIKSRTEKQKAAVPDDEDDVFGKMVACECRKIKNSKIKRLLKKKINDLLYEAAEDDEANTENLPQYIINIVQPNQPLSEQ